jgi:chromosome segregation ATPase
MALIDQTNIDNTLAIVKDLDKFKKRIEELGKAQKDLDNSTKKAKAKMDEINTAMDAKAVEAGQIEKAAKELMTSADKARASALDDANKVLGKANRATKDVAKRTAKLDENKAWLAAAKTEFAEEKEAFKAKVTAFTNAVSAVHETAS